MMHCVMQISEEEVGVAVDRFADKTGVTVVFARFTPFLIRDVEGHVEVRLEIHRFRYNLDQL